MRLYVDKVTLILQGQRILITGGTGSIGSALVEKALKSNSKEIRVFSNDENGLYELEVKYNSNPKIKFIIGDIRNEELVSSIVKNVDLVFHAAALKHVDRCELNPNEAITVNVIGTKNIIRFSIEEKVKKVISISTDKAVNPIGVMGATKLLSEKLITAEAFYKKSNTIFSCVRFGNVLQTRGSIIPHIENQIQHGGPITLTDRRMQRFFMTMEQAVDLILSATKIATGGEIFVLKMPLLRLEDLFEVMKEVVAPKFGYIALKIKTKIIGMRPGEKLMEYLLNEYEIKHALETKQFFIILPLQYLRKQNKYPNAKKTKNIQTYFKNIKPIGKIEIKKMIQSIYG